MELPVPLVPAEVDLRDFDNLPMEFRRLFASETWILGNHEEKCAAFCLWCESFHGTPAGSLPDDDRILAHLSQAGPRWKKLRAHALRGFVKCSDGRLYHSVVAEKVLEAWAKHKKLSSRGKAGASKRWGTSISTSIKNGCQSNASATKKDSNELELELEMKRKDLDLPKSETGGGNGEDQNLGGNSKSTPSRRRTAVDIALEAKTKALTGKSA